MYPSNALIVGLALLLASARVANAGGINDLVPDLIVNQNRLNDHIFVNDVFPGRVHMRLSNSTPNIGLGPLIVIGQEIDPDTGLRRIVQRVMRSDSSFFERDAGNFVFHDAHDHIHVENWAEYRVREVLPGNGVGPVIAQGGKVSFCLADSAPFNDEPVQGTPPASPQFTSCESDTQGISVGWEDIYAKHLPDQWIDITGLMPGTYWLESEVDPLDHFLELDETNNVARVQFTVSEADLPEPTIAPVRSWSRGALIALVLSMAWALISNRSRTRTRS